MSRISLRRGSATALNASAVVAARATFDIIFQYRNMSRVHNPNGPRSSRGQEVGSMPDEQQALVLSALRSASGEPVSFSALRAAGGEFPASIVSELELSGVAIERCRIAGGREPGGRLG